LYTVHAHARDELRGEHPVLVHLLDGYIDAGSVTHGTSRYLLDQCEHEPVADFDVDQLHDYRSRRPQFVFDTNRWESVIEYELTLHRMVDADGTVFLLLAGPEPDAQWRRACTAVLDLCEQFDVSMMVTASGIPMAVPHTRPTLITSHATDPQVVGSNPMWIDRVQIPGSFSHLLEYEAGQAGILARGFVAHVPHYLAQTAFPQAIGEVLTRIQDATGLSIPIDDMEARTVENLLAITKETQDDAEFPTLLKALEEQYDRYRESGAGSVPSAEEIGAAMEQFLADQDPPDFPRQTGPTAS